jgi:hypothetical protein
MEYGFKYLGGDGLDLLGYTDSDLVGSVVYRKSTSRCFFNLGSLIITWFIKKNTFVALSSTKA